MPGDVIRVKTTLFWQAMNVFAPVATPAAVAAAAIRFRVEKRLLRLGRGSPKMGT